MKPVDNSIPLQNLTGDDFKNVKSSAPKPVQKDSIEISNTGKVFDKINKFLNLGQPNRLDISDLNDSEKKEFYSMLAKLLKEGIIGYEVLEVNGKPEKHYIVNQIGDERIYGAKLYKKDGYYNN